MKLQLLGIAASLIGSTVLLAAACTITEGEIDDDGVGGQGGSSSGGQAAVGGTSSGGGSSTGGSGVGGEGGMMTSLDCSETPSGTPGLCKAADDSNLCHACLAEKCCDEYAACTASQPDTACWYGSTMTTALTGEFDCIQFCLLELNVPDSNEYSGSATDVEFCADLCGAGECGGDVAGAPARNLATCMVGPVEGELDGCEEECELDPAL